MPYRKIPLVTNELYHVLNRGVARGPVFTDKRTYSRFLQAIDYYRFADYPLKLSHFLVESLEERQAITTRLFKDGKKLVEIFCYCLMPYHFHLLVRQLMDNGISTFVRRSTDSYSKYFNQKNERIGPVFQGPFKTIHIDSDEQLIHLSRYIHINPYIAGLIRRSDLKTYLYSTLPQYLSIKESSLVNKEPIMKHFNSIKDYKKFVYDQADYKASQKKFAYHFME